MSPQARQHLKKAVLYFRQGKDPAGSVELDATMHELGLLASEDKNLMMVMQQICSAHANEDMLLCADLIEHRLLVFK